MGGVDHWANIHEDTLIEITKRFHSYSYDEYLQFRLVCKQWNFNLPQISSGNKAPCLLLPRANKSSQISEIYAGTLLKLSQRQTRVLEEKEIYHLTMPELQNTFIRGSCHGWIIIVLIYEGTIRMVNPFTKVCFDLPPISTLPNVIDIHGDKCTYDFEDKVGTLDTFSMRTINVWKVTTNSAPNNDYDFMAVVIYGHAKKLAFYKPNNPRWIKFPKNYKDIVDVIFFQEKIYAVDFDDELYEFDIKENLKALRRIYKGTPPDDPNPIIFQYSYLVGCDDGSLLMLVRYYLSPEPTKCQQNLKTIKFEVYKLKKKKKSKVWSRIYNLGNYVLIVGLNSSVQILASNCKGNMIYFTDNMDAIGPIDYVRGHDIGIFNLEDGSCERVLSDVSLFCPPIWILP